jgi:CheY-like chemotaxis protein
VQGGQTLDRAQGGLGIGLSLVRELVQMHGGTVVARSAGLGRGSLFEFQLPLSDRQSKNGSVQQMQSVPAKRIMIVDDNIDAANSLAAMLQLDGHIVEVAYTAQDTLDSIEKFSPDVMLLDLGLPHMNGYELARRIRTQGMFKNIRLIALTGYGQPEDKQRTKTVGFDAHLVKPLVYEQLQSALHF